MVPLCGRTYASSINSEIKSKGGWPLSALIEQADRIKDLPLWVFHGAEDSVVSLQHSQEMVSALKGLGSHVRFTISPGGWTRFLDKNLRSSTAISMVAPTLFQELRPDGIN